MKDIDAERLAATKTAPIVWSQSRAKLLRAVLSSEKLLKFASVQSISEMVLSRPILTHEFAKPVLLIEEAERMDARDGTA